MIRQAFLRGISTRAVGRVVAILTNEPVSAQTVSRLTRTLDREVEKFPHATLTDDWAYLLLDGVWMKVRRAFDRSGCCYCGPRSARANGQAATAGVHRARREPGLLGEGFLWGFAPARNNQQWQNLSSLFYTSCLTSPCSQCVPVSLDAPC